MAATRDPSQKITFVYSNLYKVYQDGKKAAHAAPHTEAPSATTPGLTRVIKAGHVAPSEPAVPQVAEYTPLALIGKRVATPEAVRTIQDQRALHTLRHVNASRASGKAAQTVAGLRENLAALQGLQSKIKFFLGELEEMSTQAKRPAFSLDDEE